MMDPADLSAEEQDRLYEEIVQSYQEDARREHEAWLASRPKPAPRRRTLKGTWYKVRNWCRNCVWQYREFGSLPFGLSPKLVRASAWLSKARQRIFGPNAIERRLNALNALERASDIQQVTKIRAELSELRSHDPPTSVEQWEAILRAK